MKKALFITDDFLLESKEATRLYHDYAADLPIIDYHCHLPPADIAADKRWENLTQIWLYGDHYKWRAMRTNGVDERYCTGKASDWEKFEKWAATLPHLLRNPLYHWTHLELARYFGVTDRLLSPDTAKEIWTRCNRELAKPAFSCRGLMKRFNVNLVCTTDDPTDTLEHHQAIAKDKSFKARVLPTWRPDKGMTVDQPKLFNAWVDKLAERTNIDIRDFDSFLKALHKRHEFFHSAGCRLSDHGLDTIYAADFTESELRAFFKQVRGGKTLDSGQILKFKSGMLVEFAVMDHARDWTQQFHLGALRNNNSRLLAALGPDTGFDSIGDFDFGRPLSRFLDRLDRTRQLARTILYTSNPRDNALLATMLGNFQDGSIAGKMQFGSGWWFMDQKDGMERQMEDLSQMGLLSRFVGMTTDSRSFLSYTRHEYFRRTLCNMLGNDMGKGLVPRDEKLVGRMVQDICHHNAARYFGFNMP